MVRPVFFLKLEDVAPSSKDANVSWLKVIGESVSVLS